MTQYYPSAVQTNPYLTLYPLIKEMGKYLPGANTDIEHDPMDVIHEIMRDTYSKVFAEIQSGEFGNVAVADITSSLNPFDPSHHMMQIEPSGKGGKKIAQMLSYIMKHSNEASGKVFRFFPQFFASETPDAHVKTTEMNAWQPAHPYDLRDGYTPEEEALYQLIAFQEDGILKLPAEILRLLSETTLDLPDSPMRTAAHEVIKEAGDLFKNAKSSGDIKKVTLSVLLTLEVLKKPTAQNIDRLKDFATHRADGKSSGKWKKLQNALLILAGVALMALGAAAAPFTAGVSLGLTIGAGVAIGTGVLSAAAGTTWAYRDRQKSLSKVCTRVADEASRPVLRQNSQRGKRAVV